MSPRHQISSGPSPSTSASTASSAGRLEWMSEMTATRIGRAATLAVGAVVWCGAAWLLWRTSVPSLHLSGFDEHSYFSAHALARARSYSRGEDVLWLLGTAATLVALGV